jgi:hypothetical protein
MSSKAFGSKELINCLLALDWKPKETNSKNSSHVKFIPPADYMPPIGIRPFMEVQLGRKCYDGQICDRYVSQIKRFGYTKKQIEENL